MKSFAARQMIYGAMTSVLVMITTAFIRIPGPLGYIHLGDAVVLLSAVYVGRPAVLGSAIGAALADILSGFPLYAPITAVIKAGMALLACRGAGKRRWLYFVMAALFMAAGYCVYECFIYGPAMAVTAVPFNLVQGTAAVLIGGLLSHRRVLERINLQDLK
ncbi:MAG: ECF transporter S component [Clostridia bacterium]|nr:ECF transporter S component [Clostridia bacterium]